MHELTGSIKDLTIDFRTGNAVLSLAVNEKQAALAAYDDLKGQISVKIGAYRPKRSKDANAYCWTLIGKLSEKLNIPPADIYRRAIKDVGGNYEVVCTVDAAVPKLCESWRRNGIGWQTDTMPSKLPGCTNVMLYYGSSTYDTASMSRLINIIVDECKAQGIETRTPEEIAKLLSLWGESNG
jgi:hypothetical protein